MHSEAFAYVVQHAPRPPGDVLDVGGRDINGTLRHELGDATSWTVVDLVEAPDVDVVGDICALGLAGVADLVLCLEVLEHARQWRAVIRACVAACRPGGTVLITCAGPGRSPHSADDGGPLRTGEWYRNISTDELFDVMTDFGLEVFTDELGPDSRAYGRKP